MMVVTSQVYRTTFPTDGLSAMADPWSEDMINGGEGVFATERVPIVWNKLSMESAEQPDPSFKFFFVPFLCLGNSVFKNIDP